MNKSSTIVLILILGIFISMNVSAVTLDLGLNMTINDGTSIYVDTIPIYVTSAILNDTGCEDDICLTDPSWSSGGLIVNVTGLFNWTSGQILTSQFTRFTTDNQYNKVVASSLPDLNTNVTFSVDNCNGAGNIAWSHDGTDTIFQQGEYSCSNNQVTLALSSLGDGDTITLDYSCIPTTNTGFTLIMLMFALALVGIVVYVGYNAVNGEPITLGQIVVLAIVLIVGVIFWQVAGQNLGTLCPVS